MTLVLGTFIVLLVLFMVFAMVLAEWADQDPGDWLSALLRRRSKAVVAKAPAVMPVSVQPSASAISAVKPVSAKKSLKTTTKKTQTLSQKRKNQ